jgi:hypothetical protein
MMKEYKFTVNYNTLKLLGWQNYSNPISALSELIANSIDAGAKEIDLIFDMTDKKKSKITIRDNGIGMDEKFVVENYIKIGFNKRMDENYKDRKSIMGRKGIGKLAALYLSDKFMFATKKENDKEPTYWKFDSTNFSDGEEVPYLENIEAAEAKKSDLNWRKGELHGTELLLLDCNLTGFAERFLDKLDLTLSNMFSYDVLNKDYLINFKVIDDKKRDSKRITKSYPFEEMIAINSFKMSNQFNEGIKKLNDKQIEYSKTKNLTNSNLTTSVNRKVSIFNDTSLSYPKALFSPIENVLLENGEQTNVKDFEFKGWIGIVGSIKKDGLETQITNNNKKSVFENKLRLYVNGKLAVDNLLPDLNNTQVFAKYIEGEISFDILDDPQFVDIATSNRQDVDREDPRYVRLIELCKSVVEPLLTERQKMANNFKKEEKKNAITEIKGDKEKIFEKIDNTFSGEESLKIKAIINAEIKTRVPIGRDYKIFISHASADANICDFLVFIFKMLGVKRGEYFYTSDKEISEYHNYAVNKHFHMFDIMRENLSNSNTYVLYVITDNFLSNSTFPTLEAGAGWMLKIDNEKYSIIGYDSNFIKNNYEPICNNRFITLLKNSEGNFIEFDNNFYTKLLLPVINEMMQHLNDGRESNDQIEFLNENDEAQFKKIKKYWKKYIK